MLGIRELLAQNLKTNRRQHGLTQEKLAEKAGISAHYLAMIEVTRKFPSPEILERLAKALDVEAHQLFSVTATPEEDMERLHHVIIAGIRQEIAGVKQVVQETIRETLAEKQGD